MGTISRHFAGYASVALETIWLHEPRDLIFSGPLMTELSNTGTLGEGPGGLKVTGVRCHLLKTALCKWGNSLIMHQWVIPSSRLSGKSAISL